MMDDEGLQIQQPHRGEEHQSDNDRKQFCGEAVTKQGKYSQTKNGKVSSGSYEGQWRSANSCVGTAENFRTS